MSGRTSARSSARTVPGPRGDRRRGIVRRRSVSGRESPRSPAGSAGQRRLPRRPATTASTSMPCRCSTRGARSSAFRRSGFPRRPPAGLLRGRWGVVPSAGRAGSARPHLRPLCDRAPPALASGRYDPSQTAATEFHITAAGQDAFARAVPLHSPRLETSEEFVVTRAKRRLVIVVSPAPPDPGIAPLRGRG